MLKYKAIYCKMMDDLKDAGMWIEWATEMKDESPEVAKFLISSANERLEKSFAETKKMFMDMMKDDKTMLKDLVNDHITGWSAEIKDKIKKF